MLQTGQLLSGRSTEDAVEVALGSDSEHLGYGSWGEIWSAGPGLVIKISASPAERDCVTRLLERAVRSPWLPRVDAAGPVSPGMKWSVGSDQIPDPPLFWYVREDAHSIPRVVSQLAVDIIRSFVDHASARSEMEHMRRRVADLRRAGNWQVVERALDVARTMQLAIRYMVDELGVQPLDYEQSGNWGVTADGRVVFRDLACNTGPGGWREGFQAHHDPGAVWPPDSNWVRAALPEQVGGSDYDQIHRQLTTQVRPRRHHVGPPLPCDEPWTDPQVLQIEQMLTWSPARYGSVPSPHRLGPTNAAFTLLDQVNPSMHRWAAALALELAADELLADEPDHVRAWFDPFLPAMRAAVAVGDPEAGRWEVPPGRPEVTSALGWTEEFFHAVHPQGSLILGFQRLRRYPSNALGLAMSAVAEHRTRARQTEATSGQWADSGYTERRMASKRAALAFLRRWWCELRRRLPIAGPDSATISGPPARRTF